MRRPGLTDNGSTGGNVQAMLLCRQLHYETRLLPFQVNLVRAPAVMGSNTTATKDFLERLKPFQRSAIRKLELHLLASVTEAWSLRSILRSIADVSDSVEHRRFLPERCTKNFDNSLTERQQEGILVGASVHGNSDLRELTISMTTRDLLLAQGESLAGLLHILTVPSTTPFACAASWVTEGLSYLRSLRRLSIVIEASVSVASQVTAEERDQFSGFVQSVLPSTHIAVQWKVQQDMILSSDESDEWVSLPGSGDASEPNSPQVVVNQTQGINTGGKAGWSNWNGAPS